METVSSNYHVADAIKRGSWFSRYGLSMVMAALSNRPQDIDF